MRHLLAIALVVGCGSSGGTATSDGPRGDARTGDGSGSSGSDAMPMMPDATMSACGNGTRECGEECDDGNTTSGDGCSAACVVEPYAGAPQSAIDALHAMNVLRAEACLPGAHIETHVVASSQNHASYYANNAAAYTGGLSPHNEDPNFPTGYTGVNFYDRMSAAGFTGPAMFETMAFVDNPQAAIAEWRDTVFHRIPILHPNMTRFGYGNSNANGRNNDVSDYSSGAAASASQVVVWPAPNATGVARTFNTAQEAPTPPAPPGGGGTTGPLVSVFFASGSNGTITSHSIKQGSTVKPDTMIAPSDATFGPFMMGSYCFYPDPPAGAATYTVTIAGTVNGQSFTKTWSFTTN
jgi:cysteine-rich repeat protein